MQIDQAAAKRMVAGGLWTPGGAKMRYKQESAGVPAPTKKSLKLPTLGSILKNKTLRKEVQQPAKKKLKSHEYIKSILKNKARTNNSGVASAGPKEWDHYDSTLYYRIKDPGMFQ